jgi:predicted phage-related endonuclease
VATRKPAVTPETIALDDMADAFLQLRKIRRALARQEAAEKLIIQAIKARMGDSVRATVGGAEVVIWSRSVRTQVDIPALKEKYPDVAASLIKLVEVRSFKIVDTA